MSPLRWNKLGIFAFLLFLPALAYGQPVVGGAGASTATDVVCASACVDISSETNLTCGSGITCSGDSIESASTEPAFLTDGGSTSLTCGASNQGKMQVLDDGTLEYCDGAATSVLRSLTEGAGGDVTSVLGDTTGAVPILFQNCTAFTGGDSTPDVSAGNTFCTGNAVTITDFDDGTDHTTFDGTTTNRWLDVLFLHAATLDCSSSQIYCNAGADWTATVGDFAHCIYDDTVDTDTNADGTWLCAVSNPTHFTSATVVCDPSTQVCINSADEEDTSPTEGAAGDCNWGFVNDHIEFFCNGNALNTVVNDTDTVTKTYGPFTADNMTAEGNCTITTDTAIVSGGLVVPYVTCADTTGDQFWVGPIPMPDGWNLGTVVWKGRAVNVAASPAADTDGVSISGVCWGSDDAFPTSISTTGQQACTIDWTGFTQNDDGQCVTSAITLNGTPAASDVCMFLFDVTDAGTDVASVKWHTFWMEYTWNQTGD